MATPGAGNPNFKLKSFRVSDLASMLPGDEVHSRSVFAGPGLTYLYAHLALFNKRFDEGDWELHYVVKLFDPRGQLAATLPRTIAVPRDRNIVHVHEGWGNGDGTFYGRGTYRFEAWIEGQRIAEAPATILEERFDDPRDNPYFDVQSLRICEAGFDPPAAADRRYVTQIDAATARYVWAELRLLPKGRRDPWPCELVFNFFHGSGELWGRSAGTVTVGPGDDPVCVVQGWGSTTPNWRAGDYRVEVAFLDRVVATRPFSSGAGEVLALDAPQPRRGGPRSLEGLLADLEGLIGLADVKRRVAELAQYLAFLKLRRDRGLDEGSPVGLHAVLTGNPGTGKTTVARLLGRIYHALGMLSKGHVVEVDRADLIGKYIGQTAPLVKEAIRRARGGVLFVDEAYALARTRDDALDFGREAIEILLRELSEGPGDLAIFVAGYPAPMETFLESNPGLRSRFGTRFEFPDYQPEELLSIAEAVAQRRGVRFSPAARAAVERAVTEAYRSRDASFGNARFVTGLVEEGKMALGVRFMAARALDTADEALLSTIEEPDMQRALRPPRRVGAAAEIPVQEEALAAALAELHALVGLDLLKQEVGDLVKLVRYYRDSGKKLSRAFSLHTVLTGNPGTGKTTVARLLGRIYGALGLLERGHLVECDRQGLVAGFVGQTALKTSRVLDQAKGGVLFIDEAYALAPGTMNDFGPEAIETIVKRMEDERGELAVMVAGYPGPMEAFLKGNPGLKSRFDRTLHFPDYAADELHEIARALLAREELAPDADAEERLRRHWDVAPRTADFGNAREVRKLVDAAVKRQHLRMSALPKEARTADVVRTVVAADLEGLLSKAPPGGKGPIGFSAG